MGAKLVVATQPKVVVIYTNMATIFPNKSNYREERIAQRQTSREGMLEAQRLARLQRQEINRRQRQSEPQELPEVPDYVQDSQPDRNEDNYIVSQDDHDLDFSAPEYDSDTERKIAAEERHELEPLRILHSGPYRWTPDVLNEYIIKFKNLEGKLYAHPRTKRIYEITTVFFHPILRKLLPPTRE